MRGFSGSDIPERSGLQTIEDPYTGETLYAIPALRPDWAIIHVHAADEEGNARIEGPRYFDIEMTRAAKGVIVTAEEIVSPQKFAEAPTPGLRFSVPSACYPNASCQRHKTPPDGSAGDRVENRPYSAKAARPGPGTSISAPDTVGTLVQFVVTVAVQTVLLSVNTVFELRFNLRAMIWV